MPLLRFVARVCTKCGVKRRRPGSRLKKLCLSRLAYTQHVNTHKGQSME